MTATRLQLRTRARELADQENYNVIADTTLNDWIEEGKAELHELLVNTYEDYAVTSDDITLIDGTNEYALPTDFLKERAVDLVVGTETFTLMPFEFRERNRFNWLFGIGPTEVAYRYSIVGSLIRLVPKPVASGTLRLWYVPQIAAFSGDSDTLPTSMALGWERYIVVYAAMRCMIKEESDPSALAAELARIRQMIVDNAQTRRAGDPSRIVDVRYTPENYWRPR